jgi:hypothetical protein
MKMEMTVTPAQAARILTIDLASPVRQNPIVFEGPPGIGKTAVCQQAADACNFKRLVTSVASIQEVPDFAGWTYYSAGSDRAQRVPCGDLAEILLSQEPLLWLIDDMGQAAEDVAKAFMPYLHAGESRLPDTVRVVGATNGRADRAGVKAFLAPVRNRTTRLEMVGCYDSWRTWAVDQPHIPAVQVAYLGWATQSNGKEGTTSSALWTREMPADGSPFPSPRSWESVAKRESLGYDDAELLKLHAGDVGPTQAVEYLAFRAMFNDVVAVERVLLDPQGTPIPDKPAHTAGLMAALVSRLEHGTAGPICTYAARVAEKGNGAHVGFFLASAMKDKGSVITATNAGQRLLSNPTVAQMVLGTGSND